MSIEAYLGSQLKFADNVCENSKFVSMSGWKRRSNNLRTFGFNMIDKSNPDLIDLIWLQHERTAKPASEIFVHATVFAGIFF